MTKPINKRDRRVGYAHEYHKDARDRNKAVAPLVERTDIRPMREQLAAAGNPKFSEARYKAMRQLLSEQGHPAPRLLLGPVGSDCSTIRIGVCAQERKGVGQGSRSKAKAQRGRPTTPAAAAAPKEREFLRGHPSQGERADVTIWPDRWPFTKTEFREQRARMIRNRKGSVPTRVEVIAACMAIYAR